MVADSTTAPSPETAPLVRRLPWIWLGFAVVLVAIYLPALGGGMLWDDDGHVTPEALRSLDGLRRTWFEPGATQQYYPVLHSAFWIEHRLWGDSTFGYHLLNVLLHATNACLIGALLERFRVRGAWLAAALWAVHPVAVESVAWITEQKNTLSTCFYLAAAHAFLTFHASRRKSHYAVATLLFALALGSKTMTATLPAALAVALWWQHGKLAWRRDFAPLLPWLALGAGGGLFTAWVEHHYIGAQGAAFGLSFVERGLLAGRVVLFYLGKLVWPQDFIFIYPRWTITAADPRAWTAVAGVISLLVLAWTQRARNRGPLAALLIFGGTLFPVLGFFNVYPFLYSYVADHFQYLASIAAFAFLGGALAWLFRNAPRPAVIGAAVLLLAWLGVQSWRLSHDYRSSRALYEATLERNPACWLAWNNLAELDAQAGQLDTAIQRIRRCLEVAPDHFRAQGNLGRYLRRAGRLEESIPAFAAARRLRPDVEGLRWELAAALSAARRTDEALEQLPPAASGETGYAGREFTRAQVLVNAGRHAEALDSFAAAVRLEPRYAEAELHWGRALQTLQRPAEALPHFERAAALAPNVADTRIELGLALHAAGRTAEALPHLQRAVQLNPRLAARLPSLPEIRSAPAPAP